MKLKKTYRIGISCIGSGVGQSVINSLKMSRLPIRTIGLGTNPFAYGAYDCDEYYYTQTIYASNYIDQLIEICVKHQIDLLIPGLDDEALIYAQNEDKLKKAGIKAIFAKEAMISICRDKERMSLELNQIVDVFVKSFNKDTLSKDIENGKVKFPFIAKPRGGYASRGVEIIRNKEDISKIKDNHIVQELAVPSEDDPNYEFYMKQISKNINSQVSEISIQIVFDMRGNLMGRMFSYNKLNNGVPIEILPYEDDYIWQIIDNLVPTFLKLGLRGPLNIQGRLTKNGLKLFEMNPRFTGITGLRALMGFNEVEACVKEWLGLDKGNNQLMINYNRFGTRQTEDKSISINRNEIISKLSEKLNRKELSKRRNLLVTGASGYLGRNLVYKLLDDNYFNIWTFGRNKGNLKKIFNNDNMRFFDKDDLDEGRLQLGNVDIILHLGFARPHCTKNEIAESLLFTNELFTRAAMHQVPSIINISSQSVYGLETKPLWTEQTPVNPSTSYSMAKYATEQMLVSLKKIKNHLHFTSIRLGTLAGGVVGLIELDFLSKISNQALRGETIVIESGNQQLERFDIRDAIEALIEILKSDSSTWKTVYNLSSGEVNSLKSIVLKTINIASEYNNGIKSKIEIIDKPINMEFGMDSSLFSKSFRWEKKNSIKDSITSLLEYLNNK